MIIGINSETKLHEYRVAAVPSAVSALVHRGHQVLLERGAGIRAGWSDEEYQAVGATLVPDGKTVFTEAEMVYKVKEPMEWEYDLMQKGQVLFTYIHSAGNRPLTTKLLSRGVWAIAYEDVELTNGRHPLLEPMSTIAGYMGMFKGFELLQSVHGGLGLLPSGLPGTRPAQVMILGGGFAGEGALQLASGVGAEVTLLDIDVEVLARLKQSYPGVQTRFSNEDNIRSLLPFQDIILNAVMWPKTQKGHLITRAMLKTLRLGAVIVDVSADIGGAVETCIKQTSHDEPTFEVDGVTHYSVANIPSLAARTGSEALSHVTLPYAMKLAEYGPSKALLSDASLRRGLTCFVGKMVRAVTAQWYGCEHLSDEEVVEMLKGS